MLFRSVLLDKKQLEKYMEKLACDHNLKPESEEKTYPIPSLEKDFEYITMVYNLLNEHIKLGIDIHPAGEWLLDNYYIIEERVKQIKDELTLTKYKKFLGLDNGQYAGYARIYILAKMFGDYFPPEFSITEGNAWMSTLNNSVQYISVIRPGEKVAKLVKRMHYVSFVGMFRSDLFEGLCVGHAPKKCKICGKWFLTTNARHTKYCGGYAPGDKLHRTCRQIGNLKGREQRELADDHPIIQIYEKRLNTINRYVKRGTLDADLAEVMKKLAKDKELRAKSDVAYAKGAYEKEMEQAALLAEAKIHI